MLNTWGNKLVRSPSFSPEFQSPLPSCWVLCFLSIGTGHTVSSIQGVLPFGLYPLPVSVCLSVRLSVCPSVRLSVHILYFVRTITRHRFELESPNLHQTCIMRYSQLVLKMGVIDLDLQGHLAISTQETAFNVTLIHWSRQAKGCYTSQTCSCIIVLGPRTRTNVLLSSGSAPTVPGGSVTLSMYLSNP